MSYEEIDSGNVWQFENAEDFIEGTYVEAEAGQYGDNYIIKNTNDEDFVVFGNAVLNTKMRNVEKGAKVKITYKGEIKSKNGRLYKDFKVEVDKE